MVQFSRGMVSWLWCMWLVDERVRHQGGVGFIEFSHSLRVTTKIGMVLLGEGLVLLADGFMVGIMGQAECIEVTFPLPEKHAVVSTVKSGIAKAFPVKTDPIFPV